MQTLPFLLISIFVIALLVLWLMIALVLSRKSSAGLDLVDREKHPRGYWMSVGISIGTAMGIALGPVFDNIGVGIGVGIAIGAAIGASLEKRHEDELRPLTAQEQALQKRGIVIGLAVSVVLGVVLLIAVFLQLR